MLRGLFLVYSLMVAAAGLSQQYPFVQYSPRDGLVNSRVRRIYQDDKSCMYFITYGGLSVYDGTRFTNYTSREGLSNDLVNDVYEIDPDTVLVATNVDKVNMITNGKMGLYPVSDGKYPLVNRFLKSNDGLLYAASDNGLYVLKDHRFTRLPLMDTHGVDMGIYLERIVEWKNYFLLIPWDERIERLIVYDRISHRVTDTYASSPILSLKKKNEEAWITTTAGVYLLDTIALNSGRIRLVDLPEQYQGLNGSDRSIMCFDKAGNIWAYAKNNLMKYSRGGNSSIVSSDYSRETGLVQDVFEDREGIIWMATDGHGIIKMRGSNVRLMTGLTAADIPRAASIQQQHDTIWVYASDKNSIYRLAGNEIKTFNIPGNTRFGSIYLQDQKLYLVSDRQMLVVADKNEPHSYDHPKIVAKSNPHVRLGCAVSDPYGALIQLSTVADSMYPISVYKNDREVFRYNISYMTDKMIVDNQQRLWVAPRNSHVTVFSIHPDQPQHYLQLIKDFSGELADIGPRCIAADSSGNIWIGTRYNGLYRLEISGLRLVSLRQFTTREGLTDNFVYSLEIDHNNNVWVGTQSGLDKIFLKNGRYIVSNISKSNNFFQTVSNLFVSSNNSVWAMTSEGSIMKIEQETSADSVAAPPLLLQLAAVNNQALTENISSFSYRQNNLNFTVAAPSFFDERSILYSYKLEGSEANTWSSASHTPSLTFSNLAPGHYTLHAKAEFPDATYAPQTAAYSFTIRPPWWETWWFRIAMGLAIIAILVVTIRNYYQKKLSEQKQLLEKKQAIEKERTRIATDMHDDLGAGLSRIKFLSEMIGLRKQQHLPIEEEISRIREYSHEMIDKMGEIVWALNEKNDSLSDLLSYTRAYAAEYLAQNGIDCHVDLPDQLPSSFVSGEFRRNIFLAVKEILHNVVKHAEAGTVRIDMSANGDLRIQIKDDGIGFDRRNIRPFSNGLSNIEKRMTEIGGTASIASGTGTCVILEAPLDL